MTLNWEEAELVAELITDMNGGRECCPMPAAECGLNPVKYWLVQRAPTEPLVLMISQL